MRIIEYFQPEAGRETSIWLRVLVWIGVIAFFVAAIVVRSYPIHSPQFDALPLRVKIYWIFAKNIFWSNEFQLWAMAALAVATFILCVVREYKKRTGHPHQS